VICSYSVDSCAAVTVESWSSSGVGYTPVLNSNGVMTYPFVLCKKTMFSIFFNCELMLQKIVLQMLLVFWLFTC